MKLYPAIVKTAGCFGCLLPAGEITVDKLASPSAAAALIPSSSPFALGTCFNFLNLTIYLHLYCLTFLSSNLEGGFLALLFLLVILTALLILLLSPP